MDDHFHLFDYNNHSNNNSKINACSSSSSLHDNNNQPPSSSSDEISLFLHQILYRSSSSSSTTSSSLVGPLTQSLSLPPENSNSHPLLCKSLGISAGDSGAFLSENEKVTAAAGGGNVSSSALGVSENEMTDDYDCESEEGIEALVDENPAKPAPSRNSSKRARAAEVHNLSEKRRRSRINEKMKALQNLIPNSYKTDKASMLDEAIEYLKQLQLQVQMLTMRNGSTLHPMCLPGVLQPIQFSQMRMGFGEQNGSLQMNTVGALTANQETPGQTVFSLSNQCTSSNQLQIPNMANIINSETSFGLDSSIHAHFGSFQLHASSEETCRVDTLPHQQLNVNHSETIPSVLLPFDTHALGLKDGSLQACMMGRNQAEGVPIKNFECNRILSPPYTCMRMGRSVPDDDSKLERKDF